MKYTIRQYAIALHQSVFESRPEDQERILDNFVAVLKANSDLGKVEEIEQEFFNYHKELKGIRPVEVTSAKPLANVEEQTLLKDLNEYVGGQVELKKRVDEGLVGGIIIKIGDELLDGSVRKNLQDLKSQLIK